MDDAFNNITKEELANYTKTINETPLEHLDNLCPVDMHNIVYRPFHKECPIQYKSNISDSTIEKIPFVNLLKCYIYLVGKSAGIKLTAKGNLPPKTVKELYALGHIKEEMIEMGLQGLHKEKDTLSIQNVKIMAELIGFTKKRNNKLSLTKKGIKYYNKWDNNHVLRLVFDTYGYKFNLGYLDRYDEHYGIQKSLGYTIYLLLKYGSIERPVDFYSSKILKAYPHLLEDFIESYRTKESQFRSCYKLRIFERFLKWFDYIQLNKESIPGQYESKYSVKNNLLSEIFEIRNDKFKFRKEKFRA